MTYTALVAREQIKTAVINAVKKAIESGQLPKAELPDFTVEAPANREHGDYAVNAALVWARCFHKAPSAIADIIINNADFSGTYIQKCEKAGHGSRVFRSARGYPSGLCPAPSFSPCG